MKKRLSFILLVLLISINIVYLIKNVKIISSKYEYTSLQNNEDVVYDNFSLKITNIDEILGNKIEGLLYVGRDTCPNCLDFNKFLEEEVENNENLLVYKFDTDYWREDERFQEVLDKYDIKSIPELIYINDKSYEKFLIDEENLDTEHLRENLKKFIIN